MHLATDPVNPVALQFMTQGFSIIDALNKGSRIWSPTTRVRSLLDVSHWSEADHNVGQITVVGDTMGAKSDYSEENYKTNFKSGGESSILVKQY